MRLLIRVVLVLGVLVSAAGTLSDRLHLRLWAPLTVLLIVLAALWPTIQDWLKQDQARLDKQDQKEEERAKEQADRAREDVLEQVRRAWVRPELQWSLHEQARISLGLAERPGAVENPLRAVLRRPDQPDQLLDPGQSIAQVYRQIGRQLLILGEPGAGKTTLLMELTDELLKEAEEAPDQHMPVVFHLSTWASKRQQLALWLVDELYTRYGVPRRLGAEWVDSDQVIPLLDGLDEMSPEHRDACAAAINTFHDDHGLLPLAVCSRITEYEALQAKLRLRGAIVVQPLSRVEVDRYLRWAGRPLAALRSAARDDQQLADLLTTPLFLSIVAITYKGKAAGAAGASGTPEERRRRVLSDYVAAMLTRPQPSAAPHHYAPEQTVRWLIWLAKGMRDHGQSVFYLDWMQPDWLPTLTQRRLVTIGSAVAAGLAGGLAVWLAEVMIALLLTGPVVGLAGGVVVVLLAGLVIGFSAYQPTITPTQRLRWSRGALRRKFRRWLIRGWLVSGVLVGLVYGLVFWQVVGALAGLVFGLLGALIYGLLVGLVIGLFSGLEAENYVTPPTPGMAIQRSKRNALVSGLSIGLIVGLLVGLLIGADVADFAGQVTELLIALIVGLAFGLGAGLLGGLVAGLIAGFQRGGGAYLRHYILRQLLVRNGSIPRDYLAFLDYATRLILLRRRGGGYEFIHGLLLEHFALFEPGSSQPQASHDLSRGSRSIAPIVDQESVVVAPELDRGPRSGLSG